MSQTTPRTSASRSTQALVVISPETSTKPVLMRVSQATRDSGSWARMASRIASEIWSAILSGWPSETDSEVKSLRLAMNCPVVVMRGGNYRRRSPGLRVSGPNPDHGRT